VGTKWATNGIIQCYLDLDNYVMSFGYDGKLLGTAYTNFQIGNGLFVGFSASSGEEIRFNFGEQPLKYPPPNEYKPLCMAFI